MNWEGKNAIAEENSLTPTCQLVMKLYGYGKGECEVALEMTGLSSQELSDPEARASLAAVLKRELDLALSELL